MATAGAPTSVGQADAAMTRRWLVLALLVGANTLSLLDRQLPFILIEHIRADLKLSDTQIGLLGGIAFSLTYALLGIPLARLSDTYARKWVMAACVSFWSLATAMGGFAQNFGQLAASRVGVAVAEAGCSPTAHSLIADLFPDRRGFALGLFTAGVPAGIMIGMAVGGVLVEQMEWRHVLFLAGIPGLVLGLLIVALVREPARRGGSGTTRPFGAALKVLAQRTSYGWATAGATLNALATIGGSTFSAALLIRVYGFSAAQAGLALGAMGAIISITGTVLAGAIGDRIAAGDPARRLRLVALMVLIATPLYMIAKVVPTWQLFFTFAALSAGAAAFYLPLTFAALQSVVTSDMRATTLATHMVFFNILGTAPGPILVGMFSDAWAPHFGPQALGWALAAVGGFGFLSAGSYWMASRRHNRDVAAAQAEEAGHLSPA